MRTPKERLNWLYFQGFVRNGNFWQHKDESIWVSAKNVKTHTDEQWNEFLINHDRYFDNE